MVGVEEGRSISLPIPKVICRQNVWMPLCLLPDQLFAEYVLADRVQEEQGRVIVVEFPSVEGYGSAVKEGPP